MSWSVSFTGKPEEVAKNLEDYRNNLTGDIQAEYDGALPHIVGLVKQNHGDESRSIVVTAYGSGYYLEGEETARTCTVHISEWDNKI